MKKWIRQLMRKLFSWLFKEDIEAMEKRCRDLDGLIHRQKCATQEAEVRAERIRQLMGNIDVSVDVHHHSGSWAVVSLQGQKTDYIKFVELRDKDLMEIARFLRQYDRKNVKVDASPFDRLVIHEQMFKI